MSHPRKKSVAKGHASTNSKILFMPSIGDLASLVESVDEKQTAKPMKFPDPHTALSWAMKHHAGFVFFQGANPAAN